jgi:hypothetical protein
MVDAQGLRRQRQPALPCYGEKYLKVARVHHLCSIARRGAGLAIVRGIFDR